MKEQRRRMQSWAKEETKTAQIGDARLNRRFGNLLDMLIKKPDSRIPSLSKSWGETKAAYRFFDNGLVTWEKILQPHREATIERMKKEKIVLLVQDTTELDYTGHSGMKGLGKLSYENQQGLYLHPTIAITPERICLGVITSEILIRKELGKTKDRAKLKITEKESMRWLQSYQAASELSGQMRETQMVSIADREGDIYDLYVEASKTRENQRAEWIIRGNKDRNLIIEDDFKKEPKRHEKLKNTVRESAVLGVVEFDLPRAPGRKARRVKQEIRAKKVTLKPPYRKGEKLPVESIQVVLATEIDAPEGTPPIEWVLLTSIEVESTNEALKIVEWYLCRWQIEIFFRILKSGCKVEELQLQTIDRLKPCLALYMIITWRILYMTMLGRVNPEMPCDVLFEDEEWQTVYMVIHRQAPPKIAPNLNQMIRMIATLGGFLNRKGDGAPGPQTIWTGLQRVRDFMMGMDALNASKNTCG